MDNYERNRIARLEAELGWMRRQMLGIPARWAGGVAEKLLLIKVIDGHTVFNDGMGTIYYGITQEPAAITTVPTLYNPNVSLTPGTFTAIDGIGRGLLGGVPVLLLLDATSPIGNLLVNGDWVWALAEPVSIPVGAGPTAISAYLCDFQ